MYPLEAVGWYPQDQAELFFIVKGLIALLSTLILLIHMNRSWYRIATLGQRLRYLTLFAFSALGAFGSLEQISENSPVSYRHLVGLVIFVVLVVTCFVSINENNDRGGLDPRGPGPREDK